jgi:sulfate adenylyltransferase subunit 2
MHETVIKLETMTITPSSADLRALLSEGKWHDIDSLISSLGSASLSRRQMLRIIEESVGPVVTDLESVTSADGKKLNPVVLPALKAWLSKRRYKTRIAQLSKDDLLVLSDLRGHLWLRKFENLDPAYLVAAFNELSEPLKIFPHGKVQELLANTKLDPRHEILDLAHSPIGFKPDTKPKGSFGEHSHLKQLEQESIYIIREAVAAAERPAMLFSLGKDSMVMLRLAEKAFAPEPIPFPLLNIDTRWKFQEMNRFRDWIKARADMKTIHYINPDAIDQDVNPFDFGSSAHTDITKTQALRKILDEGQFDFVFGGARRDEEKSRAKERVFSVRDKNHAWDPRNQRPELWNIYNTTLVNGQSMRVFPLSNWTELDIWRYLEIEDVPLVPLYFAKRRPYVERNGALIMVDDERFRLEPGEEIQFDFIRFRSLGCYPLSGGVKSKAATVSDIVRELEETRVSERSSRVIDFDRGASMEQKKKEGYF